MTHDIAKKKTITPYIDGWVIIATIVLLEINGGSEHRYSSRLSGSHLYTYLTSYLF